MLKRITIFVFLAFLHFLVQAQSYDSLATVMIQVEIDSVSPSITLRWENEFSPTSFQIAKRQVYTLNFQTLANLPGTATEFIDTAIEIGKIYEYRVTRITPQGSGTGFVSSGIELPAVHIMGRVLILVKEDIANEIDSMLNEYLNALTNDGWIPEIQIVTMLETVPNVKSRITAYRNLHKEAFRSVLLLGNIPVPYSGNMAPDGHTPDHQGAWPADGFYADTDGFWSDFSVDISGANRAENRNVPGDGKYDHNQFPTALKLELGRVDFSRLPLFPQSEAELTNKYLRKNIAFRKGEIQSEHRGIIQNNFGSFVEAFGQSGLKNFTNLLGKDNVTYGNYRLELISSSYLWSYGCGPGSYTSVGGITTSQFMTTDSLQTIFTMLFGSYFGDWDIANNLLRSTLASGTVLTNTWSGRPVWMFHHMGMGEPIGMSTRMTQNNSFMAYGGTFQRFTHTALMGDPTLTMYTLGPVSYLMAEEQENCALISWGYPEDIVKNFYIYKREVGEEVFTLMNNEVLKENQFCDPCVEMGKTYEYMIRESFKRETPTGSFYQLAHGTRIQIPVTNDYKPQAVFDVEIENLMIQFENNSNKSNSFHWDFGDGNSSQDASPIHIYDSSGIYTITLISSNDCFSDTTSMIVTLMSSSVQEILNASVQVFPIPFANELHLSIKGNLKISAYVILDSKGIIVTGDNIKMENKQWSFPIHPSNPPGLYYLKLFTDQGTIFKKLIKK